MSDPRLYAIALLTVLLFSLVVASIVWHMPGDGPRGMPSCRWMWRLVRKAFRSGGQ